jgi:uncharacterized protein (DUF1697 family)
MPTQIVFLRGINVGAQNRIAMPGLRELLTKAGLDNVRTYLQSGNVVLTSGLTPDRLADTCRREIADGLGLDVDVVVRTRTELHEVVRQNPLGEVATDPKLHQVSFLSAELDAEVVRGIAALAVAPEQFVAVGRELYGWHPNGVGRSKLAARMASRGLGVTATARNWTTVTALLALADE